MNRRGAGIALIAVAAFLHATRYVCAAIYGSGMNSHGSDLFRAMLQYVGPGLSRLSAVCLVAGIAYLVWAEADRTSR
ncbi:MAG: hypothetical protein ACM3X4_13515 [Ignavibacteriales bacterium]